MNFMRATTPLTDNTRVAGIERLDGVGEGITGGMGKRFLTGSRSIDHHSPTAGKIELRGLDIINPGFEASSIKPIPL